VRHARTGVWLAVRTDARQVVITVSDDGPGITPGERERVFERFVRLDGGRARAEGGTGLGLAVCRAIARAHGGDVRVVEPDHGGAMLEVRLPLDGHDRGARALE
jgi:signal transduction histidine kinase